MNTISDTLAADGPCWSVACTWGSTPTERACPYPCDAYLDAPTEALYRAIDVDAPAPVVFRWLCQLRVAPYSYDWLDNFGRQSPRQLTPGLDALALGQRLMGGFELVAFERDRHLTASTVFAGVAVVVSYVVIPRGEARSRLVVKLLLRYPRGPVGWLMAWIGRWGDLIMMRKQLLNLADLSATEARR